MQLGALKARLKFWTDMQTTKYHQRANGLLICGSLVTTVLASILVGGGSIIHKAYSV